MPLDIGRWVYRSGAPLGITLFVREAAKKYFFFNGSAIREEGGGVKAVPLRIFFFF